MSSDNSARKDEIAEQAYAFFIHRQAETHQRTSFLEAVEKALTSYEEERPTSPQVQAEAILEAIAAVAEGREVSDFMLSFPIVRRVDDLRLQSEERTPSGEGWQQRIAAKRPWITCVMSDRRRCYFCGIYQDSLLAGATHEDGCLWQNAVDATPPASGGEGASKP